MAVPGRRNGLLEDDEDDENPLFEENGLDMDLEADIPPHLRDLAAAAEKANREIVRVVPKTGSGRFDPERGERALGPYLAASVPASHASSSAKASSTWRRKVPRGAAMRGSTAVAVAA